MDGYVSRLGMLLAMLALSHAVWQLTKTEYVLKHLLESTRAISEPPLEK